MLELSRYASLIGSSFTFLFALSLLFKSKKTLANYLFILLLICNTIIQGSAFFVLTNILFSPGFINFLYIPFNFLFGPALYFCFFSILNNKYRMTLFHFITFIPGLFILLLFPVLNIISPGIFADHPLRFFKENSIGWLDVLFTFGFIYDGLFYLIILSRIRVIFRYQSLRKESSFRIILAFIALIGIISMNSVTVLFTGSSENLFLSSFLITIIIFAFFIFNQKFPEFFTELDGAMTKARYETSKLGNLDTEEIKNNLERLMLTEEVFKDENLNLKILAGHLCISSQQLSEYLNKILGISFSRYISQYRVETAKNIFLEEDGVSIMSVAYKVGFNSKSTFNLAFVNHFGMSPSQYIKKFHKKK